MTRLSAQDVTGILRSARYPTTTERALQDAVETRLTECGLPYAREARLGPADRIDFLVAGDIGVEVKARCTRLKIYRQLERYAENHDLRGLILLTGTFIGLPQQIAGVPVFLVSTGRAAL